MHLLTKPFYIDISSTKWSTLSHMSQVIKVPMHYKTDLGTIPLIAQLFLGGRDDYAEIYVLHDWCCDNHIPYFISNAWLRSGLYCVGCPWYKRLPIYYAVMVFGYDSLFSKGLNCLKRMACQVLRLIRRGVE